MSKFLECSSADGSKVYVSLDKVTHFANHGVGARIYLTRAYEKYIDVAETAGDLRATIERHNWVLLHQGKLATK